MAVDTTVQSLYTSKI